MSVKEEGRGGGSELGSDLDSDPDPWKILWIRIRNRQNGADPLDPDPQHCLIPALIACRLGLWENVQYFLSGMRN